MIKPCIGAQLAMAAQFSSSKDHLNNSAVLSPVILQIGCQAVSLSRWLPKIQESLSDIITIIVKRYILGSRWSVHDEYRELHDYKN